MSNLKNNSNACFTVVGSTELLPDKFGTKYTSVIAFGKVRVITDDEQKKEAMLAILRKYSSAHMEAGIKYMEEAVSKVNVLEFDIINFSGKGRK